jgi:Cu/Zn superoxide dismutase
MFEKRIIFSLILIITRAFAGHGHGHGKMAECTFKNSLKGTVKIHFTNDNETDTMFMGSITNLAEGIHGFHVHEVILIHKWKQV